MKPQMNADKQRRETSEREKGEREAHHPGSAGIFARHERLGGREHQH
jgi:hypothetical protein